MLFSSILPLISQKAVDFAIELAVDLGVKAGQAVVKAADAARDAVVDAGVAVASASASAWETGKESAAGVLGQIPNWLTKAKSVIYGESPDLKKSQAIREYNALLGVTGTSPPEQSVCMPCLAASKARRRQERQELMRAAQNKAAGDPLASGRIWAATNRLAGDMDRVEDAKLALHTYTANEEGTQEGFLKSLKDQAPPGFAKVSPEQVAADLGMDPAKFAKMVNDPESSQKIMFYERDVAVLGPSPKYTVAFRGSTTDDRDWNNNGKNEMGFEAPHQANAIRLGSEMAKAAKRQNPDRDVRSLISVTGHSKGGSEAQAFAAASGVNARVFNPAGFDPKQYSDLSARRITSEQMNVDRTTVIGRDVSGQVSKETTDPLYYSQHEGFLTKDMMIRPITTGGPRELDPIKPSLIGADGGISDTEPHSMLQVIEGLERDKKADEQALKDYLAGKPDPMPGMPSALPLGHANSSRPIL